MKLFSGPVQNLPTGLMTEVRGVSSIEFCHEWETVGAVKTELGEDDVSHFGMLIALISYRGVVCMNEQWGYRRR